MRGGCHRGTDMFAIVLSVAKTTAIIAKKSRRFPIARERLFALVTFSW